MRISTNCTFVPSMHVPYLAPEFLLQVDQNDPAWWVQEGYALGRGGDERHRYQVMLVPRNDVLGAFWTDLGVETEFMLDVDGTEYLAPPYQHLVLGEHTVAECQDYAVDARKEDYAVRMLQEQVEQSTLFEDYARLIEQDLELVRNRSSFGAHSVVQRTGYSAVGAQEQRERLSRGQ